MIKEFKFKGNETVIKVPVKIDSKFRKLDFKTDFDPKQKSANTVVFINKRKEFLEFYKKGLKNI